jgi:hypothetical protein
MTHLKYIKKNLLLEQDILDPMSSPVEPKKKEERFNFLFIEEGTSLPKLKKYPDGSSSGYFPTYSVTEKEIKDWVNKNIVSSSETKGEIEVRRNNLIDLVKGKRVNISKEDIPHIKRLKTDVLSDSFGKNESDLEVTFTKDGKTTTNKIDITFIKYKE